MWTNPCKGLLQESFISVTYRPTEYIGWIAIRNQNLLVFVRVFTGTSEEYWIL